MIHNTYYIDCMYAYLNNLKNCFGNQKKIKKKASTKILLINSDIYLSWVHSRSALVLGNERICYKKKHSLG